MPVYQGADCLNVPNELVRAKGREAVAEKDSGPQHLLQAFQRVAPYFAVYSSAQRGFQESKIPLQDLDGINTCASGWRWFDLLSMAHRARR